MSPGEMADILYQQGVIIKESEFFHPTAALVIGIIAHMRGLKGVKLSSVYDENHENVCGMVTKKDSKHTNQIEELIKKGRHNKAAEYYLASQEEAVHCDVVTDERHNTYVIFPDDEITPNGYRQVCAITPTIWSNVLGGHEVTQEELAFLEATKETHSRFKRATEGYVLTHFEYVIIKSAMTKIYEEFDYTVSEKMESAIVSNNQKIMRKLQEVERLRLENDAMLKQYSLRVNNDYGKRVEELVDFAKANHVVQIYPDADSCMVKIYAFCDYQSYDQDEFDAMVHNDSSVLYHAVATDKIEDHRMLLKAIFSEQPQIKLLLGGRMDIRLGCTNDNTFDSVRGEFVKNKRNLKTYLGNPHIAGYSCFGGNAEPLSSAVATGDIVAAANIFQYAVSNINFGDHVVVDYFMRHLQCGKQIFETLDGKPLYYEEAISYLKEAKRELS